MAVTFIPGSAGSFSCLSADVVSGSVAGAKYIGGRVFVEDTGLWYIISANGGLVAYNQGVSLTTRIAGEDLNNDVLKTENRFAYKSFSAATSASNIKTGSGLLHTINILGGTAGSLLVWDSTGGSGTLIVPGVILGSTSVPVTLTFDTAFNYGLTFTTGCATIISFSYR